MNSTISILVPAYNEEEVLWHFNERMSKIFTSMPQYNFHILYIDDGSQDRTLAILKELRSRDNRNGYLSLSRNFGKEIAMAAGFDHIEGDAVIIIDADLQDPPELIPEMIRKWEEGFEDVYAQRISRKGETWLKKWTSHIFYSILAKMSNVEIQRDTGDFRLLSRRAIESLKRIRESERYTKGLFSILGYHKVAIPYNRDPRAAGKTKWNYFKLFNLAVEGITSFTTLPLKLASLAGIIFAFVAFIYMAVIVFKTIVYGDPVRGYPSMVSIILFLGGIQLISLGIIGEYVGRTFLQTKNRPLYFLKEKEISSPNN